MHIHIHKNGQNYGPFSIEQVRKYLKAGNFSSDDHGCHDGTNWVKLSQVPGISPEPVTRTKAITQKKPKPKKKIRKSRLVIVSLCVLLFLLLIGLSIVGLINLIPVDETESVTSLSNNETLFILSPKQVVDVYDGDTFKIDLPSMHPLFGKDLSIRLFGVDTPEMRGTTDEVKALAMQAQQVTEKALQTASEIELKNPQRGKYFRIVSEVWIDGKSLADTLKAQGLAKDYNGEGARPEW